MQCTHRLFFCILKWTRCTHCWLQDTYLSQNNNYLYSGRLLYWVLDQLVYFCATRRIELWKYIITLRRNGLDGIIGKHAVVINAWTPRLHRTFSSFCPFEIAWELTDVLTGRFGRFLGISFSIRIVERYSETALFYRGIIWEEYIIMSASWFDRRLGHVFGDPYDGVRRE